jgi:hypothetical protein
MLFAKNGIRMAKHKTITKMIAIALFFFTSDTLLSMIFTLICKKESKKLLKTLKNHLFFNING